MGGSERGRALLLASDTRGMPGICRWQRGEVGTGCERCRLGRGV